MILAQEGLSFSKAFRSHGNKILPNYNRNNRKEATSKYRPGK